MRQLKRIIVGHDLGVSGEVALGSAVALANRVVLHFDWCMVLPVRREAFQFELP